VVVRHRRAAGARAERFVSAPVLAIELARSDLAPGERVRGVVRLVGRRAPVPPVLRVRLLWYTEGKGDQDVHTVEAQTLDPSGRFEFQLPASPYSFSGKLVSLIWAIEVENTDVHHAERATFVMAPDRRAIALHTGHVLGAGEP
jgi:hypothetical protein